MTSKIWGGRFQSATDAVLEAINVSIDFDKRLGPQDVRGSLAHVAMLGKQGYRVTTFLSGELALAWLAANGDRVDLLVTDQNMPGLSGIDVAREVVRIRPGLRVAIMSGYVSDELREQARLCGVHEVLAKQDRVDDLVEAVRSLLPAD